MTCSTEGCERPHKAKGLCNACYMKAHRKANPTPRKLDRPEVCSTEGCDRPHKAKGLCRTCYMRAAYHANPEKYHQKRKESYRKHKAKERANWRAWRDANREELNKRRREAYAKNPEQERARAAEYRKKHPYRPKVSLVKKPKRLPPVRKLKQPKVSLVKAPRELTQKEVIAQLRAKYWNEDGTKKAS